MLSKSDFKVTRTCPTKLYYRELRYPTTLQDDPYLEFLADGGFMIETLAHLHSPNGKEMPFLAVTKDAALQNASAFKDKRATLFEATFIAGELMARINILDRNGRDVSVVEVKAKSIDTSKPLAECSGPVAASDPNGVHTWRMSHSKRSCSVGSIPSSHSRRSCVSPTKARPPVSTFFTSTSCMSRTAPTRTGK